MSSTKKAVPFTIGGVLIVGIALAIKLFGGPDLLADAEQGQQAQQRVNAEASADTGREREPEITLDGEPNAPAESWPEPEADTATLSAEGEEDIRRLIDGEISGEMVLLSAEVVKHLPDDTYEPRHQRFLLGLVTGGTVLVAHNIDLAERVPVDEGEVITVYGQYEWNDKGGLLHWTHHDPKKWREGGWIEHDGTRYE